MSSKDYWERRQHRFPHQISVPYMSDQDLDPGKVPYIIGWRHKFLRVPYNGMTHWGFETAVGLYLFKKAAFSNTKAVS